MASGQQEASSSSSSQQQQLLLGDCSASFQSLLTDSASHEETEQARFTYPAPSPPLPAASEHKGASEGVHM